MAKIAIILLLMLIWAKWTYAIFRISQEYTSQPDNTETQKEKVAEEQKANRRYTHQKSYEQEQQKESYKKRTYETPKEEYVIPSPWEILNLTYGCQVALVKSRYRTLAKQYHPDIARAKGRSEQEAILQMQKINAAYEEIMRFYS